MHVHIFDRSRLKKISRVSGVIVLWLCCEYFLVVQIPIAEDLGKTFLTSAVTAWKFRANQYPKEKAKEEIRRIIRLLLRSERRQKIIRFAT